ncbi:DNA methyltransferase [Flavobacterium branchiophilum]|nr:type ISP restriction/modification enzyme [Flavobacterium branchiophilum]OXA75199.1 DNA methyltransferase [Flavobacterium branchiophilum] [Flavobacterium branchiophilum NBRC 15030 = ATCC 35035]GEM56207.1 DNA methyltransferase [Flavobacterium branchiophilum NBRC 15030 = ATCC 35035]
MTLIQYIDKINTLYKTGNAREHSYRGDLQNLIMAILPDILVTNEPARVDCGAPDYVLTRKDVPIGYIEAKDIGVDLGSKTLKEQFDRYKSGLTNLIFTDYMDFHFYKEGEFVTKIAIAKVENGAIVPIPENLETFTNLIKNFSLTVSQTIKSPTKLAQMMAGKAKLMADVIEKSLHQDDIDQKRSQIKSQMLSFQQMLIHDIDNKAFADIYAQTIAYGMFAARYHDPTLLDFSREEAARLIPKSNPFLRKLFQDIAGYDLDNRLVWIVDELVSIFLASDVATIMKNFGKSTKQEDPVVHFYETFLGEYNPALRKARGVWYTPQPVVNFIVRAVDDILKTEFNLPQGLADTSKISPPTPKGGATNKTPPSGAGGLIHKVQILDPATGTGTFLAEVVKHIYKKFEGQQGIWSKYVTNDLIPRLNGFELLMASYAMAHLKMDMLLTETGYRPPTPEGGAEQQRLKIFLTNSLEEAHPDTQTLFSSWLSDESNQANEIKRDTPVMVIIGNPPYSGISSNNGKWISDLIDDYKYVDGVHFNERKHWLNDDYVKFLRFGQHFIEKNGSGVLAFINPHGFLDNPTFRGMRWHLLKTYDKIYTIDLHGNSKKKETAPDGSADVNVFDIQQGVSINIFIKTGKKKEKELGKVFHFDLFGKRELKYDFLSENSLKSIDFKELEYNAPNYFFVPKNDEGRNDYENGFKVNEIFNDSASGIVTANDALTIFNEKEELIRQTEQILLSKNPYDEFKIKDSRRISKEGRIEDLKIAKSKGIMKIYFRPFDIKFMYKFEKNEHWINSPRIDIMKHFIKSENVGLVVARQCADDWKYILCTKNPNDFNLTGTAGRYGSGYTFPLYLYPDSKNKDLFETGQERTPNLNMEIVNQIATGLGLTFSPLTPEGGITRVATTPPLGAGGLLPIDILDYIYAVLHSPTYREKYKEFLKIDFPRVPYPKDKETFWQLVQLGGELRQIHLLESPIVEKYITGYPEDGDNVVKKPTYKNGHVYINDTQYFSNVPEVAWNFYIGGYQPAQKWLKDRKDRELSYEDILHYQKIIVALSETDRIMKEIDKIEI